MRSPLWLRTVRAVILFGVSLSATRAAAAKAQMLCVDPANVSCQPTIQGAVNHATKNAVITVAAGTFSENVSINPQSGSKAVKLTLTITEKVPAATVITAFLVA